MSSPVHVQVQAQIVQLLVSPLHRYEGRPTDGPAPIEVVELVDEVEIRAHRGIVGDRYFGKRAHQNSAVTIEAAEYLPSGADLTQTRRNILLRGFAIDETVGRTVTLDSGAGPVRFAVHRPANPCAWMDVTIGPGSRDFLKGHGGVRTEPLDDGTLQLGPVTITVS